MVGKTFAGEPPMTLETVPVPQLPALSSLFDEGAEDSPDMALMGVLATLGESDSEAKVNLYRIEKGKPDAFIDTFTPDEFDLNEVRSKFGGGEYRVRVYNKDKVLAANKRISIEGRKEVTAAQGVGDIPALIQSMQESNRQLLMGFAQMMQQKTQQPSRQEMLAELVTMKEIFGQAAPQQSPFDVMRMTVEMMRDLNPQPHGEAGSADVFMKLIETFGGPIANGLTAAGMNTAPGLPARAQIVAPQLPSPQPQSQPQPQQDEQVNIQKKILAEKLKMLCAQAERNADPLLYAELVADNVPEAVLNSFLTSPTWLDELVAACPDVNRHREWFTALHGAILALFEPEPEPQQNPAMRNSQLDITSKSE